jgi:hypothetical protein
MDGKAHFYVSTFKSMWSGVSQVFIDICIPSFFAVPVKICSTKSQPPVLAGLIKGK